MKLRANHNTRLFWGAGNKMSEMFFYILLILMIFVTIDAGVLVYGIAVSTMDSKKIIKVVLIATAVCVLSITTRNLIMIYVGYILFAFFIVIFSCVLGKRTGNKFNWMGSLSLIAYLFALFKLPIISNEYEDSLLYWLADEFANYLGEELTPTQFGILGLVGEISADSAKSLILLFVGIILFAILFFCVALIRKNFAQVVIGSVLAILTAGLLYFNYHIFHSKSLAGKIAGYALSELGFSLSMSAFVILLLALLPVITAYICNKKDKESR